MVEAANNPQDSEYNTYIFQALCLFAFFSFSRVGEITASKNGNGILVDQVSKLLMHPKKLRLLRYAFAITNIVTTSDLSP